MKNIFKISLIFLMFILVLSCEDDREIVTLNISEVTGGEIAEMSNSPYTLLYANANNDFDSISWEPTNYGYPTSIIYTVQLDTAGTNFENAVELGVTAELSMHVNIEDLNDILVDKLEITPEVSKEVIIRVVSSINGDVEDVTSDPISLSVIPYDPNIPPIYLGNPDLSRVDDLQSAAPLIYTGIVELDSGLIFKFYEMEDLSTGEEWGYSYFNGSLPAEFTDNGDDNIIFTGDKGTYSVTVNLNENTIVTEKQEYPATFHIVGDDQGWNLGDPLAMRHKGGGVFVGIETFNNGSNWRFFETASWGATQWNYNTFADGNIDEKLSGTTEGDANFQFIGETGIYKITVNTLELTITIEPAEAPTMFRVGGFNGWAWDESMTWIRGEKFTVTSELIEGQEWRFFPEEGNWGNTVNYTAFNDVPSDFWSGPNGGDNNFLDVVSGTYTITIDAVQGIITAELQPQ